MKKTSISVFLVSSLKIFGACLFLSLFNSCGLDVFYYLDPPVTTNNKPSYTDVDLDRAYFSFVTKETDMNVSTGTFTFCGTRVVYKIYDSPSLMISRESNIASLTSLSSTNPMKATELLCINNTSSDYRYQELCVIPNSGALDVSGADRNVYIRLTDMDEDEHRACICVGSDCFDIRKLFSNALRINGKSFNFGEPNSLPSESDSIQDGSVDDFCIAGSSYTDVDENLYYVDLYAYSFGQDDATFTEAYSEPLFLGSVKIDISSGY